MCDSQSPAELVLTWAGPAVIGCQIGKDELFLPFGEPACVLWIVDESIRFQGSSSPEITGPGVFLERPRNRMLSSSMTLGKAGGLRCQAAFVDSG
jgi:hypothetical protein